MQEMEKISSEKLAELRAQIRKSANMGTEKTVSEFDAHQMEGTTTLKHIYVRVSEDAMSAYLTLEDPGDEQYIVPELMGELRKNKVLTGIKTQTLIDMVNNHIYDEEICVAQGKELLPAVEAYYEFLFDTVEHKTPVIREDGTTDYSSVGRLENVEKGQKVAIYHPAVGGENGFNVMGREMVAKIPKELPVLRGQHIEHNEETNEYFATIAGKISLKEYNIEILDVHEINDDVTLLQGRVEFFGDLYINGDVENGVIIRAGRNLVITGTVGAANISAGGDIILQKGIQGAGKGKVSAHGNIFSDFIEYASVSAGQDVYANSIINSVVNTDCNVIVSGTHGSIIGGETHGLKGITTNAAGNRNEVKTVLHAGIKKEDYENLMELNKLEAKYSAKLDNLVGEMTDMLKQRAKSGFVSAEQKQRVAGFKKLKEDLYSKIEEVKEEKVELSKKMVLGYNASITVRGEVFRNVMICIDAAGLYIYKNENFVKYICKGGEIERRTVQ